MVQLGEVDGVKGYIFSQKDLDKMIKIEWKGKTKYFISQKLNVKRGPKIFDKDECLKLILEGKSLQDVAEIFGRSKSYMVTNCVRIFGTSSVTKIREQNTQK